MTVCVVFGIQTLPAQTNRVAVKPPLPALKSPVESFRKLLAMPTTDRREFLTTRTTNIQSQLAQKLREYQALTPEERELRLKATELRWYLQPLMNSSPTNRAAQLALIPETMRPMVTARIEQWDRIPAPVQQMFLTNDRGASYFARVTVPTNSPPFPPTIQLRRSMTARINQLFDLTPEEKEALLSTLSDTERTQMEKTMEAFDKLSPAQRRQCLVSFKQFAGMTLIERQEFLKNAERWSKMTPEERQSWRELVSAAPKMPPIPLQIIKPPHPDNFRKPEPAATTNGG